jgi:hypothetical protein
MIWKYILLGLGCGLMYWGGVPFFVALGAVFIGNAFLLAIEEIKR